LPLYAHSLTDLPIWVVITTVIQSILTTDARILDIDRKVRLVGSVFLIFLAFLPIPVVLLVLLLQAVSPGGLNRNAPLAEPDNDPEADVEGNGVKNEKKANSAADAVANGRGAQPNRVKGEPTSGFGPSPVTKRDILESALVIIVPAALLTFEQGVRTAQAFYTPPPDGSTPWVSGFDETTPYTDFFLL
jgi:hypothetical protein